MIDGTGVGFLDGLVVGLCVGFVGVLLGVPVVGFLLGDLVGNVGFFVGRPVVGLDVVGVVVGLKVVGAFDGLRVGFFVGLMIG